MGGLHDQAALYHFVCSGLESVEDSQFLLCVIGLVRDFIRDKIRKMRFRVNQD
jgi:hypothetical protein